MILIKIDNVKNPFDFCSLLLVLPKKNDSMVMYKPVLPIVFPEKRQVQEGTILLAVDIGGTKTDLALYTIQNQAFKLLQEQVYESQHWQSFAAIAKDFFRQTAIVPHRVSIAAAGPVRNGKVKLTNLNWVLDVVQLRNELEVEEVLLLNDLEAKAYGLAMLSSEELLPVYAGNSHAEGNAGIIAPGTGLGEGGLYWDGETFHPFATEGGHTDFGPRTELDIEFLRYLQQQFGHVSWERILSGPGIFNIYQFLRDVKGVDAPQWLHEKILADDHAQVIGEHMEEVDICAQTIHQFVRYLAMEASNLALKMKATGGLFIGGGITPKIWNEKTKAIFLEHFFQVGRLRALIEAVPVNIILNNRTAVLGAAFYGSYQ